MKDNKSLHNDYYYYNIVRINIKKHRKMSNLTQQQLADKIDVSMHYISQIESANPNKYFTLVVIGRIADALNIDIKELNGHYEGLDFIPPKWLNEILSSTKNKILVIDRIDTISKEEQLKFVELLKYRKISTFELPKDCLIIITANEINTEKISNEIFSLVAHI